MFCLKCGTFLEDKSKFCTHCGAKQPEQPFISFPDDSEPEGTVTLNDTFTQNLNTDLIDDQLIYEPEPSVPDQESIPVSPENEYHDPVSVAFPPAQEPEQDQGATQVLEPVQDQGATQVLEPAQDQGATQVLEPEQANEIAQSPEMAQTQGGSQTPEMTQFQGVEQTPEMAQSQGAGTNIPADPKTAPVPLVTSAPPGGHRFLSDVCFGIRQKGRFNTSDVSKKDFTDCLNEKLKEKSVMVQARTVPVIWDDNNMIATETVIDLPAQDHQANVSALIHYSQSGEEIFFSQCLYPDASNIPTKTAQAPENLFKDHGVIPIIAGILITMFGAGINNVYSSYSSFMETSEGSSTGGIILLCGFALIVWGGFLEYIQFQWRKHYKEWKAAKLARESWYDQNVSTISRKIENGYPDYEILLDTIDEACQECFGAKPERS